MDWVDSYVQNNHEVKLKQMEIKSQQQTLLIIGIFITLLIIILYSYFIKNKNTAKTIHTNSILREKLDKLEEFFNDGILTEEEFKTKRKQIIEKYDI